MVIAEQIATYLSSQGIGSYTKTSASGNIFIDKLSTKNQTISIFNRQGIKSDSSLGYSSAGIQVIYKGDKNPLTSSEFASRIFDSLHGFEGAFAAGQNHIVSCLCEDGSASHIGSDVNGVHEYSLNFIVEYKR